MRFLICFLLSLSYLDKTFAEFVFSHSNCKIRIQRRGYQEIGYQELLRSQLSAKGFKIEYLLDDRKLFEGELYANLDSKRDNSSGLYNDCLVKISIKKANSRFISDSDKVLFSKEVKRSFPRVTFDGKERCKMAIKDAFVHIPECRKI